MFDKLCLTLHTLNLALHIVNGVGGLNLKCDGFAREGLDEDLHSSTETKDKVEGRFLFERDILSTRCSLIEGLIHPCAKRTF
jgi:hypothetical protein